jgi:ribosomal protein L37AE/L43A
MTNQELHSVLIDSFDTCGSCGSQGALHRYRRSWHCKVCGAFERHAYPSPEQIKIRARVVRWFAVNGWVMGEN